MVDGMVIGQYACICGSGAQIVPQMRTINAIIQQLVLLIVDSNYGNPITMSSDEAIKPAIIEQDGEEGEKKFRWPPLESNPEVFTNYLQTVCQKTANIILLSTLD